MKFLFISYDKQNCGVNQYGQGLYRAFSNVGRDAWTYAPVMSVKDIDDAMDRLAPDVAVYNWHGGTLGAIVHPNNDRRYSCKNVAILHELTPAEGGTLQHKYFQGFMIADPTFPTTIPMVHPLPRCIPKWDPDVTPEEPPEDRPIFGAFGFAVASKGWEYVPGTVEREYDRAEIRLHIPPSWAVDPEGENAKRIVRELRAKVTKDVTISAHHELLTPDHLLGWLASNTANLFTYYPNPHSGISSSVDWAIAAGRPFAVSPSGLFKHLHHLPIVIGYTLLKDIVKDGDRWAKELQAAWSEENFVIAFYNAIGEMPNV